MKNKIIFKLKGYTVQGTDIRDNSTFEDFTVKNVIDGEGKRKYDCDIRAEIVKDYGRHGYAVEPNGIIEDIERTNKETFSNSETDIFTIEIDLLQLYIDELNKARGI